MRSLFLLLALNFSCFANNAFSQYYARRYDPSPTTPGYAAASMTLTIKISSGIETTSSTVVYPASNTTLRTHSFSPLLIGTSTFRITGMFPGNVSGWYTLPTVVGAETLVAATDPGMTYHTAGYGYSVKVKYIGGSTYEIRPTKFECFIVPCPGGSSPLAETAQISSAQLYDVLPAIYPNPVKAGMNLSVMATADQPVDISITDIFGRKVLFTQHSINAGHNIVALATTQLATGNYFLHFSIDNQLYTLKFTKE